jgi:hypothetical protein
MYKQKVEEEETFGVKISKFHEFGTSNKNLNV